MRPRVVITGVGLVTPVGNGASEYWRALTGGKSGIGPITLFDTSGYAVKFGGEVKNLDFSRYIPSEMSRKMSRASKLAVVAAKMALDDSGLVVDDRDRDFIDVFMGTTCPDFVNIGLNSFRCREVGERGVSPLMPAMIVPSGHAGNISLALGLRGETLTVSTACSSSTNAIGHALRKIRSGGSRLIFAGGTDVGVQAELVATYSNARVLSRRNEAPEAACRPFEAHRDGHVLSEAAAVLLLEEYEHARARHAEVYAEVAGYGTTTDCHSMVSVSENEEQSARCLRMALEDAGRDPEQVDLYCAHGSSSRTTDARETRMLKRALKDQAYKASVTGIKSMTGHPFGASGALQTATCALAIKSGVVPPTINFEDRDPECDLDYTPNEARERRIGCAVNYSLGMGNNAALALAAC